MDDEPNEPVEEFDVTLERTVGLDPRISLLPVDARVVIYDEKSKSALIDLITVSKHASYVQSQSSAFPFTSL